MLHESPDCSVRLDDRVATIGLHFSGVGLNCWCLRTLASFRHALHVVERYREIDLLVIRSDLPGGFSAGFAEAALTDLPHCDTHAATFARLGAEVFQLLNDFPLPTLAYVEGPCLGPGLALAMACDVRIARADLDSQIGLGADPLCWGLSHRLSTRHLHELKSRGPLTAREAVRCGLFHDAFSARRAKIEFRTWQDQLRMSPRLPKRRAVRACEAAAEIKAFRQQLRQPQPKPYLEVPQSQPGLIALEGDRWLRVAEEVALRGGKVILIRDTLPNALFRKDLDRGRVTPLEADQARARILLADAETPWGDVDTLLAEGKQSLGMLEPRLNPACPILLPRSAAERLLMVARSPQRVLAADSPQSGQPGLITLEVPDNSLPSAIERIRRLLLLAQFEVVPQEVMNSEPAYSGTLILSS